METDALKTFHQITGRLWPSAELGVARAKSVAERALPGDTVAKVVTKSNFRTEETGVALAVDPVSNVVVARVIEKETGETVRQIPSVESVRFLAASRKLLGEIAGTKYKEAEANFEEIGAKIEGSDATPDSNLRKSAVAAVKV